MTAFYQTDNPRLGNAGLAGTKSLTTGFLTQDAFVEWKLAGDRAALDVGLFYTPQSRAVLTGSATSLSFDTPAFSQQQVSVTGSSAGRDIGAGLKGYLLDDRLEYRAGVFAGQRQTAAAANTAGSRNSPRAAARLQYDFLDKEKGYTYVGTNRGARSILAVGAWGDTQGDFRAYGFDAAADIPIGKNAVTAEVDYLDYDGGRQFTSVAAGVVTPLLPKERGLFTHAGYYLDKIKLQPFLRYERLDFREERLRAGDQQRYGGGVNWYVSGQNLKVTAFYERIVPKVKAAAASIKATNHAGIQLHESREDHVSADRGGRSADAEAPIEGFRHEEGEEGRAEDPKPRASGVARVRPPGQDRERGEEKGDDQQIRRSSRAAGRQDPGDERQTEPDPDPRRMQAGVRRAGSLRANLRGRHGIVLGHEDRSLLLDRCRERLALLGDEHRGEFRRAAAAVDCLVDLAGEDMEDVAGLQRRRGITLVLERDRSLQHEREHLGEVGMLPLRRAGRQFDPGHDSLPLRNAHVRLQDDVAFDARGLLGVHDAAPRSFQRRQQER